MIVFLIFPRKKALTFYAKLFPKKTKCKLISEKKKKKKKETEKYFKMSSAELFTGHAKR